MLSREMRHGKRRLRGAACPTYRFVRIRVQRPRSRGDGGSRIFTEFDVDRAFVGFCR